MRIKLIKNEPIEVPYHLQQRGHSFSDLSDHIGKEFEVLDKNSYEECIVIDFYGKRFVLFHNEYEVIEE